MERITKQNYEAFYLDYLEDNLSEEATVLLFAFLEANPDCKAEVEGEDDILDFNLNAESINLTDKEDLKLFSCKENEICLDNYEQWLIADLEGELSADDSLELATFVEEHNLEQEKKVIFATVLKPNLKEVFGDTSKLKRIEETETKLVTAQSAELESFKTGNGDINLDNYEDWFTAELEGELSSSDQLKLTEFALANHLELERKATLAAVLKPNLKEVFGDKALLKRSETETVVDFSNYEDLLIAELEGELSETDIKALSTFIKANHLEQDRKAIFATILKPNLDEQFGNKAGLKRKEATIIPLFLRITSIAAAIALIALALNSLRTGQVDASYLSRQGENNLILPEDLTDEIFEINNNTTKAVKETTDNVEGVETIIPTSPSRNATMIKQSIKEKMNAQQNAGENLIVQQPSFNKPNIITIDTSGQSNPKQNKPIDKPGEKIELQKNPDPVDYNDLAFVEPQVSTPNTSTKKAQKPLRLKERYRPVTKTINSYTNLDVSFKQTEEKSDVAMTQIKVGKFSFERKKRK